MGQRIQGRRTPDRESLYRYSTPGARLPWPAGGCQLVSLRGQAVLSSSKHISKGRAYHFLRPWLGRGLLTSDGQLWHTRRKLLTPAFHFRILDQFSEHLQEHASRLVDDLAAAARDAGKGGAGLDVAPIISRLTLRAIMVTAMGKVDFRTNADSASQESEHSYFEAIHRVGAAVVERGVQPWLWVDPIFHLTAFYRRFRSDLETLHGFTSKIISERKSDMRECEEGDQDSAGKKKRTLRPFLDVLLAAQGEGADLSDRDIREEVDTFMFEGHDTTSVALGWALELLGRHAAVQDALAEELRAAGSDWSAVSRLPFLDRVLKECLRLRPSVPFISRYTDHDIVLSDGKVVPADAVVNILIYDLHRHPDHFPDPERFDPDRFLPEKEQARHPFAYVPFSAGPRNCIGKRFAVMELKLLLAAVIRSFHVRSGMPSREHDMFTLDLVLRPSTGVFLHLTPR
ncbi:hypothetical protein ONE63_000045 [Megalurothrips usitatus]|uniref:Cytochrome P450 4C1-like n=1 Tax=Megalurothrips usitatus TaxID=439358 RepID=A0AAV7Y0Q1_9NEOP|nr:hypothetical protein ONE63_000045 [Megalurothrips usitatus]